MFQTLSNKSTSLNASKSHVKLAETAHGVRMISKNLSKTRVQFDTQNIMIVTKARDNSLVFLTREVTEYLLNNYPGLTIYVDYHLKGSKRLDVEGLVKENPQFKDKIKFWDRNFIQEHYGIIDLVITLGGDGTVLYSSSLFQRNVPPVISFNLGSLGFLTNFKFEDFKETLSKVLTKGARTNLRMRFTCRVHSADGKLICEQQALNEVTIDRGPSPFVSMLELYGDGSLLTVVQADGLIIATPTGSTAYSLSAGGSLVHPNVNAISVTPICPHTLSFRPIILPDSMVLRVKLPKRSRSTAWVSFDGRSRVELQKGYYVTISASPFPFPTVISKPNEYFDSVSRSLNWNIREQQKSFVHLLSTKNKTNYEKLSKVNKLSNLSSICNNDSNDDLTSDYKSDADDEDEVDNEDYDSPPEIDDNDLSTYFVPPSGQGVETPVPMSLNSSPLIKPKSKLSGTSIDLTNLKLDNKDKGNYQ